MASPQLSAFSGSYIVTDLLFILQACSSETCLTLTSSMMCRVACKWACLLLYYLVNKMPIAFYLLNVLLPM